MADSDAPAYYPLTVYRGRTKAVEFVWETRAGDGDEWERVPLVAGGWQARMQIRARAGDRGAAGLVADSAAGDGRLVLEPEDLGGDAVGVVRLRLGADVTETVNEGAYDVEMYRPADPSEVRVLVGGPVAVVEQVTQ